MLHSKEKTVQYRGSVAEDEVAALRSLAHAAFQRQGLTGHKLEIGACQLDADAADFQLGVAVVPHGRHFYIGFESIRVSLLELLQLGRPCQRADHIDVDAVRTPLGSGNTGKPPDAFLGGGIGALAEVAEQARTGRKVDDAAMRFFQVGIARFHIVERGVQT